MSLRNLGFGWLQVSITIASIITTSANSSLAQITPDETLPDNSNVRVEDNTRVIEGGTEEEGNLFHSFSEFSVPTGLEAWFNNSAEIQNIFSRVTGGSISNIDGLIRANGAANLFLLNPNGIIFGPNASLDVGGSFVGTSAESLKFADGSEFSAVNPQSPPLLTVNVPMGLQYGPNPGSITVGDNTATNPPPSEPTLLEVPPGETLALIGGEINLNGSRLRAPGGRIELGGLAAAGTVGINNDGSLSFPDGVGRADVSINGSEVDVAAGGGGSITVNAKNLEVTRGSELLAGIGSGFGTPESVAGELTINATDTVLFDNSFAYNRVNSGGVGKAGNLSITTGSLEVLNGAFLSASIFDEGKGEAGNIAIKANDLVKFDGEFPTGAFSQVNSNAMGDAGDVSITTGSLEVLNGAFLSASTFGEGNAGSVTINADNLVKFDGEFPTGAFSQVNSNAVGNAGGVSITTGTLEVTDGAEVSASTFGQGNAGSVTINADDLVKFDGEGSRARSQVEPNAVGNAGGVSITTGSLEVTNGAQLSASTNGQGDAGNVKIEADGAVELVAGEIISTVGRDAEGNGGNIKIQAQSLSMTDSARLNASTSGQGNAGKITITATNDIELNDADILSQVLAGGEGDSLGIEISAGNLTLTNQADILSRVRPANDNLPSGRGNAGNITITTESLSLSGEDTSFSTSTSGQGNAGNIKIQAQSLSMTDSARLNASTSGQGNAGKITITATNDIELNDADILSQVLAGGEGDSLGIEISAGNLTLTNQADILSRVRPANDNLPSGRGNAGNITITTESLSLSGEDTSFSTSTSGQGNAGNIKIQAQSLSMTDSAEVSASTFGQGNAGSVTINADDLVKFDGEGSRARSIVGSDAVGNAGGVSITTSSLEVLNGAQLSASTFGEGNAGSVTINADNLVKFDGEFPTGARSNVNSNAMGDAGDVSITTGSLEVLNGAELSASTLGQGNGGSVTINADNLVKFDGEFPTGARSKVNSNAMGDAGDVSITTGSLEVLNGAELSASTLGQGNGGSVTINADDLVKFDGEGSGAFSQVNSNAMGDAGGVSITTSSLEVLNGASFTVSTFGQGNAGSVTINADDLVKFDGEGSGVFSTVNPNAMGDAGGVSITTGSLEVTNGALFNVSTRGKGNAGSVTINADDLVKFDGEFPTGAASQVEPNAEGKGGDVSITTGSLEVLNGAFFTVDTFGQGNGGSVTIDANDLVKFDGEGSGAASRVLSNAEGKGGDISITANSLEVLNGAQLSTNIDGEGNAGDVSITTGSLALTNGGIVSASTFGLGNAGSVEITADDTITFDGETNAGSASGAYSQVNSGAEGDAGGVRITTGSLALTNGGIVSASTFGLGNVGSVEITADDTITFDGETNAGSASGAYSQVNSGAEGNAGGVTITTGSMTLTNGGRVSASTSGLGDAGDINITTVNLSLTQRSFVSASVAGSGEPGEIFIVAEDTISLDNSIIRNATERMAVGNSEGINITTDRLLVTNGAQIITPTFGQVDGGDVNITAFTEVSFDGVNPSNPIAPSSIFTIVNNPDTEGNGGDIDITTDMFSLSNGARLTSATNGVGDAGNITINATNVSLTNGSDLDSRSNSTAQGNAGEINITTDSLILDDGLLSATTFGAGKGGNLTITADTLQLKDGGTIAARSTGTGISGNIRINLKDNFYADNGQIRTQAEESRGGNIIITAGENIFLRNNSDIRTTLSTTEGSGGDISLNANAIVALEDSDILAFAPQGSGGNITFNTNAFLSDSLFNTTAQTNDPLTESELNQLNGNNRVDVNATGSISSGTISGIPDTSQLQNSLTQLTTNAIDTEAIVASSCVAPSRERRGTFYIVGQASLPYRPGEAVPSVYSAVGVQPIPENTPEPPPTPRWKKGDPIIEPTGVYLLENGQRILSRECGT